MRELAFFAPVAAVLAIAATPAMAGPASVNVTIAEAFQDQADALGQREVQEQAARLGEVVRRALESSAALEGAHIELVLTDLKPNRPTYQQMVDRPGLDGHRSLSTGGATIEGRITMADGRTELVRYRWYSTNLADVRGFNTWQDAERAYRRLAGNLAEGRYSSR